MNENYIGNFKKKHSLVYKLSLINLLVSTFVFYLFIIFDLPLLKLSYYQVYLVFFIYSLLIGSVFHVFGVALIHKKLKSKILTLISLIFLILIIGYASTYGIRALKDLHSKPQTYENAFQLESEIRYRVSGNVNKITLKDENNKVIEVKDNLYKELLSSNKNCTKIELVYLYNLQVLLDFKASQCL